jgi:hypothetical protein
MTLTELNAAVLQELGVLASGESPVAGDAAIVQDKYANLHATLLNEGLVTWTASDDIPAAVEGAIVAMVAHLCAKPFGVPQARRVELELAGAFNLPRQKGGPSNAEKQLRRQLGPDFVYAPMRTQYL